MQTESPFHPGEKSVQSRLGVSEAIEPWARKVVRRELTPQHQDFYAELPFLIAAARDSDGRPWASVLSGRPGFATSPDPARLIIDATPVAGDALEQALHDGADLGLLGIELETRRRNRVNGQLRSRPNSPIELVVGQAFGNCPQYISSRTWHYTEPTEPGTLMSKGRVLNAECIAWIERADTFFIATGHRGAHASATDGMDASHRGGAPGFVRVSNDQELVFPDYAGNNHFNTLGNLELDPRIGLLFLDFENGGLLQVTGRATVEWASAEIADFPGAQRLIRVSIEAVNTLAEALPLRWSDARATRRDLRVVAVEQESDDVTSFSLAADGGGPLADFDAGQHLPIELHVTGESTPLRRTYSLSNAPGGDHYRISVKRETHGVVSRALHAALNIGDTLKAYPPQGEFVVAHGARPVVLISAGIGVTPMVSMLNALVAADDPRPVTFIHVARDGQHHPLAGEVRALVAASSRVSRRIFFSRPRDSDTIGIDYDESGRPDAAGLAANGVRSESDFYLCGPVQFMAAMQHGLETMGVLPEFIHSESFGPSNVT
jgi:ferredoxin-NADP reductase